jgi:hypothetical protein
VEGLQDRAHKEGGNAVINIKSNYKNQLQASARHPERRDVWFWMIPLAGGRSSVGCVAEASFLDAPEAEREDKLRALIREEPRSSA